MTDAELIDGFERATLPPDRFDHAAHVRAAYLMLRDAPLDQAAARFITALRRFAAAAGVPGKYDEALTRSWLRRIHERLVAGGPLAWPAFAAANPELLARRPRVSPATAPPP